MRSTIAVDRGQHSSLDALAELIDWVRVDHALGVVSCAAKGEPARLYRAVDRLGKTLDFMLSWQRDEAAASAFFARTIGHNGWPDKVVTDKSGANVAGLRNIDWLQGGHGWLWLIEILQVKYLNNMIEQDHRFIKKITRPMKGFKSFWSASATPDGIEVAQ